MGDKQIIASPTECMFPGEKTAVFITLGSTYLLTHQQSSLDDCVSSMFSFVVVLVAAEGWKVEGVWVAYGSRSTWGQKTEPELKQTKPKSEMNLSAWKWKDRPAPEQAASF